MNDVDNKVKMIVEGLLLAAGRPLTLDNIIQVFSDDEKPDRKELKAVMDSIARDCNDRGFELKEVASGFRFQVKQDLSEWVAKLWEERPPRYTRALLETLALIAYRQPITRGDIEEIRGVAVSSNIIRTLLDREWVRVVGHRDVPGRPAMFATTRQFLDYFNLKSLQELPPLSEIKELDKGRADVDLEDDLKNARVLELPEDAIDEGIFENEDTDLPELLDEEEAIELSKKPLDEILNLGSAEAEFDGEDGDGELSVGSLEVADDPLDVDEAGDVDQSDESLEDALDADMDDADLDDDYEIDNEALESSTLEFSTDDDADELERD